MNLWAVILNIWRDDPIYHSLGRGGLVTRCGRKVGVSTPLMPRKHAEKFARHCRSCQAQEAS